MKQGEAQGFSVSPDIDIENVKMVRQRGLAQLTQSCEALPLVLSELEAPALEIFQAGRVVLQSCREEGGEVEAGGPGQVSPQ